MKTLLFKIEHGDWSAELQLPANESLETLAEAIIKAVGFDMDHCYGFYNNLNRYFDSTEEYTLISAPQTDQVSDQVKSLLKAYGRDTELSAEELRKRLDLRHKPTFRKNYLNPALAAGWIEMTAPSSPRSPTQRYRLTHRARRPPV